MARWSTRDPLAAAQEISSDDHSLHLRGPLVDLHQLGVAVEFLHGVLSCVAVAAEDLHGIGRHLVGVIAGYR